MMNKWTCYLKVTQWSIKCIVYRSRDSHHKFCFDSLKVSNNNLCNMMINVQNFIETYFSNIQIDLNLKKNQTLISRISSFLFNIVLSCKRQFNGRDIFSRFRTVYFQNISSDFRRFCVHMIFGRRIMRNLPVLLKRISVKKCLVQSFENRK